MRGKNIMPGPGLVTRLKAAGGAAVKGRSESPSAGEVAAPLHGLDLGILTFALAMATFMQVLDTTIANVAIPTIAGNLGASASQGTWVITSYGVANAIALPATGWLAKRFGEVEGGWSGERGTLRGEQPLGVSLFLCSADVFFRHGGQFKFTHS